MNRILLLFMMLLASDNMFGQFVLSSKGNNQQLVEDIVKNGFFISKQSYQICDRESGELFGLKGNKEFGIRYTLGLKLRDGYCLSDEAVRPWLYDDQFDKYAQKYDPIFYQALYSDLKEQAEYDTLSYDLTKQKVLVKDTLYHFVSDAFHGQGFLVDSVSGAKKGWVVWISAKRNQDLEQSSEVDFHIYRKDLEVSEESNRFDIECPVLKDRITLGGVYVVPVYTNVGVVEFRLCGIIIPTTDKWVIHCLFAKGVQSSDENVSESGTNELTPAGKMKQNEKKKKRK